VTPFLSLLGTAVLVAAPVEPPDKSVRFQKLADGLAWKDPEKQPVPSFEDQLPDYHGLAISSATDGHRRTTVEVAAGDAVRYSWEERDGFVFIGRKDVLYRADYSSNSSGCSVVAFDLKAGKELWKAELKGLGPIRHWKYCNRVLMERVDDTVFAVYGQESAGRYVELVEFKTGRTVGHKVFPRE
jgi:hypothetical protein